MTPEQIERIVQAALRDYLPAALRESLPAWYMFVGLLTVTIVVAAGAYFGSYLQARAERKAITETLGLIELKTEEIKTELAGGLWLRQKRWELRREIYSQLLTSLDALTYALEDMHTASTEEARREIWQRMLEAFNRLATGKALGGILLVPEAVAALDELKAAWNSAREGNAPEETLARVALSTMDTLKEIARRDLLEEPPTPR
jgi:hypothetical protein